MPIYEYRCEKCGKTFELLQKIEEAPATQCVECGGKLQKLISQTSFQLKGSGWYATDYKNKDSKKGEKAVPDSKDTKDTTVKPPGKKDD
jgi:putative FmdB family regulatory protein